MSTTLVLFTTLIATSLSASITPAPIESATVSPSEQVSTSNTPNKDIPKNSATYPQTEVSSLPLPQYYYPTYPEYVVASTNNNNNSDEDFDERKTELVPAEEPPKKGWFETITTNLMPFGNMALSYGARTFSYAFQLIAVAVIGLIITTSVCTFTPLCTISFAGIDINQHQVKNKVTELARYMTPENFDAVSDFALKAVEKYSKMKSMTAGGDEKTEKRRR